MTGQVHARPTGNALRLWRALLALFGPGSDIVSAEERPWASVTFTGARHIFALRVPLADAAAPLPSAVANLPDHQFILSGEIVADCVVTEPSRHCDEHGRHWFVCNVEILTITAD